MGRKILFITTDQMRYDALGCNGGTVARTPVADSLAASGVRFERAYCANVICTPARSTMLTGQYPRTHGAIANGVPLPDDAPSVAAVLAAAGYATALIGKVHFEPIADPEAAYLQNRIVKDGTHGPYRGFDHVTFAGHGPRAGLTMGRGCGKTIRRRPTSSFGSSPLRQVATPGRRPSSRILLRESTITPIGWPIGPSNGSTRSLTTRTGSAG